MRTAAACFLLLQAACRTASVHPLPPAARASLAVASVDPTAAKFDVAFKRGGKAAGIAHIEKIEPLMHSVSVGLGDKPPCRIGSDIETILTRITAVGTVDVEGRGDEVLFLLNEDGGTGSHDEIMLLVDPRDCGVSGLAVTKFHGATHPETPEAPLGRVRDPERRSERRFLDAVKYHYGYVGRDDVERQKDDPRWAFYFWARDNGAITDGAMKIRRYKGEPVPQGSATAKITDGNVIYYAEFKGGVLAYDSAKKQHYALFHPQDMYAWPTALLKAGPYLVIGTRGEGVATVDLRNFRLKRYPLDRPNNDVQSLERRGSAVVVNEKLALNLPGL